MTSREASRSIRESYRRTWQGMKFTVFNGVPSTAYIVPQMRPPVISIVSFSNLARIESNGSTFDRIDCVATLVRSLFLSNIEKMNSEF